MSDYPVDPQVRVDLANVVDELAKVQREVLDPLLRRAFVVAVQTQRQYPTGCDFDEEAAFHQASGWTRLCDALDRVENAVLTARLDGPKYTTPVEWLDEVRAEIGLRADYDPYLAVTFERDPMAELELLEGTGRG